MNESEDIGHDPYAKYWKNALEGKLVLFTVHPAGASHGAAPIGFVVARVLSQDGEVLVIDVGATTLEIHESYIHRILMDDEAEPSTLDGLPRLN